MIISYEFITGEKMEIEVEEGIGEVMIEIEEMQSRKNRAETRRHNSLESLQENKEGHVPEQFADMKTNVEQTVIDSDETERLHRAVQKLDSRDALIVKGYFFEDKTMAMIGRKLGISEMAVSKRLKKIPNKIKNFLKMV